MGLFLGLLVPLLALLMAELWAMSHNPTILAMAGADYRLYMDAASRWLGGGSLYPSSQLAGAYTDVIRPVLYPPPAMVLFVPFTVLAPTVWYGVPVAITIAIVAWHRPSKWGWLLMGATFASFPMLFLPYVAGTPTIWIVAFFAIGTRWPWAAALVLLKPSLFPFGLLGIRDHRWWVIAGLLGLVSLVLWPLTADWVRSVTDMTGERAGPFYSLENVPIMVVPLFAWLFGRHAPRANAAALRMPRIWARELRSVRQHGSPAPMHREA